jgi:hypothetical protein
MKGRQVRQTFPPKNDAERSSMRPWRPQANEVSELHSRRGGGVSQEAERPRSDATKAEYKPIFPDILQQQQQ